MTSFMIYIIPPRLVSEVNESERTSHLPQKVARWISESHFCCFNSWGLVLAVAVQKKLIKQVAFLTSSELHIKYRCRAEPNFSNDCTEAPI